MSVQSCKVELLVTGLNFKSCFYFEVCLNQRAPNLANFSHSFHKKTLLCKWKSFEAFCSLCLHHTMYPYQKSYPTIANKSAYVTFMYVFLNCSSSKSKLIWKKQTNNGHTGVWMLIAFCWGLFSTVLFIYFSLVLISICLIQVFSLNLYVVL